MKPESISAEKMPRGKRKVAVAAGNKKQSKSTSSTAKAKVSLSAAKRRRTSSDVTNGPPEVEPRSARDEPISPNSQEMALERRSHTRHVSASEGVHADSREVAVEHTPDPTTSSEHVYPSTSTERGRTRLTSSTDTTAHGEEFLPMSTERLDALLAAAYAEGARSALVTHPHEFATSAEAGGTLPSTTRSSAAHLRARSPSAEAGGTLPPAARLSTTRLQALSSSAARGPPAHSTTRMQALSSSVAARGPPAHSTTRMQALSSSAARQARQHIQQRACKRFHRRRRREARLRPQRRARGRPQFQQR